MKPSALRGTPDSFNKDVLIKISAIEQDLLALKRTVLKKFAPSGKKVVKLKGVLKGSEITDADIDIARTSLYSKTES